MSFLPTRTPWFQRGDRLRLFYIKYVCVHTMQQTFSCNICVTRLNVSWCLIMPSQFLLSIPAPFFTSYHLNCHISILVKIVSVTGPGTINRFLMFLNFWITRSQGTRFKDLWSSLLSGVGESWDAHQSDICVKSFHPRTTIIKLAELIKSLRQLAAWCLLKGNVSRRVYPRSVRGVQHVSPGPWRGPGYHTTRPLLWSRAAFVHSPSYAGKSSF